MRELNCHFGIARPETTVDRWVRLTGVTFRCAFATISGTFLVQARARMSDRY